jgi:hypothetical protein
MYSDEENCSINNNNNNNNHIHEGLGVLPVA